MSAGEDELMDDDGTVPLETEPTEVSDSQRRLEPEDLEQFPKPLDGVSPREPTKRTRTDLPLRSREDPEPDLQRDVPVVSDVGDFFERQSRELSQAAQPVEETIGDIGAAALATRPGGAMTPGTVVGTEEQLERQQRAAERVVEGPEEEPGGQERAQRVTERGAQAITQIPAGVAAIPAVTADVIEGERAAVAAVRRDEGLEFAGEVKEETGRTLGEAQEFIQERPAETAAFGAGVAATAGAGLAARGAAATRLSQAGRPGAAQVVRQGALRTGTGSVRNVGRRARLRAGRTPEGAEGLNELFGRRPIREIVEEQVTGTERGQAQIPLGVQRTRGELETDPTVELEEPGFDPDVDPRARRRRQEADVRRRQRIEERLEEGRRAQRRRERSAERLRRIERRQVAERERIEQAVQEAAGEAELGAGAALGAAAERAERAGQPTVFDGGVQPPGVVEDTGAFGEPIGQGPVQGQRTIDPDVTTRGPESRLESAAQPIRDRGLDTGAITDAELDSVPGFEPVGARTGPGADTIVGPSPAEETEVGLPPRTTPTTDGEGGGPPPRDPDAPRRPRPPDFDDDDRVGEAADDDLAFRLFEEERFFAAVDPSRLDEFIEQEVFGDGG